MLMKRFLDLHAQLVVTACMGIMLPSGSMAQNGLPPMPSSEPVKASVPTLSSVLKGKLGLITRKDGAGDGYVLLATKEHPDIYLIDMDGNRVHEWRLPRKTSLSAYLLPSGNLLRTARSEDGEVGDIIEELTWDGDLVWEYVTDRSIQRLHHDIEPLPNGNILVIAWERKGLDEYLKAGRNPDTVANEEMWVDAVYEVKPTGTSGGEVVWRWAVWDHLIQSFKEEGLNYGNPSEHPFLIDLNQTRQSKMFPRLSDWLHVNSVAYHSGRDEIVLSVQALCEMWVISRKTGKLVYRWGNPQVYGKGGAEDQVFFSQHDVHWIPEGLRGAGNMLVFNNEAGNGKGDGEYSSVLELEPPLTATGDWPAPTDEGFPPCKVVWEYTGKANMKFYSRVVSNTQRLENGNTMICIGAKGLIIELDQDENIVWAYVNPVFREGPVMKKLENWNAGPPEGGNLLFRAHRYEPDYAAFTGRDLLSDELLSDVVAPKQSAPPAE